jgi:predicted transcriptional regulator
MNESFGDELKSLNYYENVNFFMIEEEINPPEIVLGDEEMTIIFFNLNGKYDYRELLSSDNASLDWGNELFDYYKGISKPLVEK